MKELLRTKRLIIAVSVFLILLFAGFLTLRKPQYNYKLTPEEAVIDLSNSGNVISLAEAVKLTKNKNQDVVFVDIRDPFEFGTGHIENAVNIPVPDILGADNMGFIKSQQNDSSITILYGGTQQEANGPWMLLHQIGFQNIKILGSGYQSFMDYCAKNSDTLPNYDTSAEQPVLNFAEFVNKISVTGSGQTQPQREAKKIIPVKHMKKSGAEGGC